jgi:hypothetical protein
MMKKIVRSKEIDRWEVGDGATVHNESCTTIHILKSICIVIVIERRRKTKVTWDMDWSFKFSTDDTMLQL